MTNPSRFSNWIDHEELPRPILVGALPSSLPKYKRDHLDKILPLNIDLLVSLTEDHEGEVAYSYFPQVIRLPTPDGKTNQNDPLFKRTVQEVASHYRSGSLIFIHCLGGHGRSGTFAACLLQEILGVTPSESISIVQEAHGTREHRPDRPCPHGNAQYALIRRYPKISV